MKLEYTSIKDLIARIEKTANLEVKDGYQENRYYCLEISNSNSSIRLKVLIP